MNTRKTVAVSIAPPKEPVNEQPDAAQEMTGVSADLM
jgi:hypothetical protein